MCGNGKKKKKTANMIREIYSTSSTMLQCYLTRKKLPEFGTDESMECLESNLRSVVKPENTLLARDDIVWSIVL